MFSLTSAFSDLRRGLAQRRLWQALAWEDIKTTYRRSSIGILWITVSFAAFIGVKMLIFSPFMPPTITTDYYVIYLTLGYLGWTFIHNSVSSSTSVFVRSENWIKSDPLPFSTYVYQSIARNIYNFVFSSLVAIAVMLYYQYQLGWYALLAIPALFIFILNAIWVEILFGVLCTRFRDVTHLVATVMRFMFFMVPVFWLPEQMGSLMRILWWNPFVHFVWIFRSPLLDNDPVPVSWIFTISVTLVGWIVALFAFAKYRSKIVFWF